MKQCWINLYATGWYHRAGKKGTMNAHPGDMYETEAAAKADIDHNAPYLATVACMVPNEVIGLGTYPEDDPLALSTSRNWHLQGVEYMRGLPVPYYRPPGHPARGTQLPIRTYGQPDSLEQADASY